MTIRYHHKHLPDVTSLNAQKPYKAAWFHYCHHFTRGKLSYWEVRYLDQSQRASKSPHQDSHAGPDYRDLYFTAMPQGLSEHLPREIWGTGIRIMWKGCEWGKTTVGAKLSLAFIGHPLTTCHNVEQKEPLPLYKAIKFYYNIII